MDITTQHMTEELLLEYLRLGPSHCDARPPPCIRTTEETALKYQQAESDVEKMANAIHTLNTAPNTLILHENDKDVLYAALLAFDHEWKIDHWWTPFGAIRTMAELRKIRDRVAKGELPPSSS